MLLLVGALYGSTAAAEGAVAIHSFEAYATDTQAGGHPDVVIKWETDTHTSPQLSDPALSNDVRDITIDLPAGVVGNPHAYPKCLAADFVLNSCPTDSQIGIFRPSVCVGTGLPGQTFCYTGSELSVPVFNLLPEPDQAGLTGFTTPVFNSPVYTTLSARTGDDYGLRAKTRGLQHVLPVAQ
jgi:hypothetical protein